VLFTETELKGVFIVDIEPRQDNRGLFARTFCVREFEQHGLAPAVAQCNLSVTYKKGTIRGMHYLVPPSQEAKLVRCISGAIHDVVIDMRSDSPTYTAYIDVELTGDNRRALYVPPMFAHGFQTLTDDVEIIYQMSDFYAPEYERGLRFDDPSLNIRWPLPVTEISEKDAQWPYLTPRK
jgi:dTDP-4-dehydrorhamnose 3,5-epimerase